MSYSQRSKDLLAEQLRTVFVTRGYDGATLANLSRASGLSKASLYHHFPGGKPEMVASLVRHSIADLQRSAFSRLSEPGTPIERLIACIDGFVVYTDNGRSDCLLAVLKHHDTASAETEVHQSAIAAQFDDWHERLADVFIESGLKEKKAHQQAYELVAALYGALLIAKMHNNRALFTKSVKRYKKRLHEHFTALPLT